MRHVFGLVVAWLCMVLAAGCAMDHDCVRLYAAGVFDAAEAEANRCVSVSSTAPSYSIGDLAPDAWNVCLLARPVAMPAAVYRVAELIYVLKSPVDAPDAGSEPGTDASLPPHAQFVYARLELVESWEEGAAASVWASAYDEGSWPDAPRTLPALAVGDERLFLLIRSNGAGIAPMSTFERTEGFWVSDAYTMPDNRSEVVDVLTRTRAWLADAGVTVETDRFTLIETVTRCPDELEGTIMPGSAIGRSRRANE